MSLPGWYPDPSGAPHQFRFWDGRAWSAQTTDDPRNPMPESGRSPGPPRQGGQRNRGMIIGVLALVLVLLIAGFFVIRSLVGGAGLVDPAPSSTVSGWDDSSPIETPTPTPTPTPTSSPTPTEPTVAPMNECPEGDPLTRTEYPADGRIHGGNLSFAPPAGFDESGQEIGISWAYDVGGVSKQIEPTWIAMFAVGQLRIADGFEQPEQAADAVMQCLATSAFYRGFIGSTDVWSKAITVAGSQGWYLRSEVRVDNPDVQLEGDVLDVIVLDVGNPEGLSMFIGAVPIGDAALGKVMNQTVADLKTS